jgi:protein-tyrosine-phosphatase
MARRVAAPGLQVKVDAAGTHGYHVGQLPDPRAVAPPASTARLGLLLDYAPELALTEVPDPYYGGSADFERVLDPCTAAARRWPTQLADLRAR